MSRLKGHRNSLDKLKNHLRLPVRDKSRQDSDTSEENSEYDAYISFYQCPQTKSDIIDDAKMFKWRSYIIDELIDNELKFYNEMRMLSLLLTSGDVALPISTQDFRAIYLNLPEYITVSKDILSSLQRAKHEVKNSFDACIGESFLNHIPKYKEVLLAFVKEYDPHLLEKRPHLRKYFDVASRILHERDGSTLAMADRIFGAFQRPFKITCLFERLLKNTPENHPDCESIRKVVRQMTEITACADNLKRSDSEYMLASSVNSASLVGTTEILAALKNLDDGNREYYQSQCDSNCKFAEFLLKWVNVTTESTIVYVKQRQKFIHNVDELLSSIEKLLPYSSRGPSQAQGEIASLEKFKAVSLDVISKLSNLIQLLKKPREIEKKVVTFYKEYKRARRRYSSSSEIPQATLEKLNTYRKLQISLIQQLQTLHKTSSTIISLCLYVYRKEVISVMVSTESTHTPEISDVDNLIVSCPEDIPRGLNACFTQCLNNSKSAPLTRGSLCSSEKSSKKSDKVSSHSSSLKKSSFRIHSNVQSAVIKFPFQSSPDETSHLRVGETVIVENIGDDSGNMEWARIRTIYNNYHWYPTSYLSLIQ